MCFANWSLVQLFSVMDLVFFFVPHLTPFSNPSRYFSIDGVSAGLFKQFSFILSHFENITFLVCCAYYLLFLIWNSPKYLFPLVMPSLVMMEFLCFVQSGFFTFLHHCLLSALTLLLRAFWRLVHSPCHLGFSLETFY